ncbi:Cysteine-rich repeat secretory protein like [Actinidia chinensis var. chinensis]|uniref:Cysteine-rich repeat secretory protein like n=1 Tax=Actinidia chinensis var. chinensis TaxID=1590841 RepID=A0A2R6PF06_ACTCC|nr:Cysteine-rich repeat secretory protein like [Actinidia chinensis var. chinensis]
MGLTPPSKPLSLLFRSLPLLAIIASSSDYTTLIYKGCADQKFQDPSGVFTQNLKTLFDSLQSQSSAAKFYKTTSGDGQSAVTGLFQCRGDLSSSDCRTCVSKIPEMSLKLCDNTIAARIQLTGCYMRYEVAGFKQVSGTELLYKVCGSTRASGAGFGDRLRMALGEIVKGIEGSNGFYTGTYESVFVLGQCEGDLGSVDCVDCAKSAVDRAQSECGDSISGQIYLQKCYVSYAYYPNGVPTTTTTKSDSGTGNNTQKTAAIVVGGVAGLGFVIACFLVLKSAVEKKEGKY